MQAELERQVVAQPAKPEADQGLLEKMKAGFAEAVDHVVNWYVGTYGRFEP